MIVSYIALGLSLLNTFVLLVTFVSCVKVYKDNQKKLKNKLHSLKR